ncbi:MAG: methyltransferase domain-containing protein [Gaiellaceae bacterium]
MDFTSFVLSQLPPPPGRVLDVGCGDRGGVVPALVEAGYDAFGIDPRAPAGPRYRQGDFRDVEEEFDAVVAGRLLHHVHPLGGGLERLAELAPLLLVDELAWDLIDAGAQDWYEGQYRMLAAAGSEPKGPRSLDEWRAQHPDIHPHDVLLDALRARYDERALEWGPYFHRWLGGPSSEALEQTLTGAGAFPAIGWHWAGVRRMR